MLCKPLVVAAFAAVLPFAGLAWAQDSGAYKVLKVQLVGGDGGFDYVTRRCNGHKPRGDPRLPWHGGAGAL